MRIHGMITKYTKPYANEAAACERSNTEASFGGPLKLPRRACSYGRGRLVSASVEQSLATWRRYALAIELGFLADVSGRSATRTQLLDNPLSWRNSETIGFVYALSCITFTKRIHKTTYFALYSRCEKIMMLE
jgi:hypothetical protein